MNNTVKLILLDIDGTIVDSQWNMLPYTKQVLSRIHDKGILLGIASGRPCDDIAFHIKKWDLPFEFDVYVGLNGCEIKNDRTGQYSLSHELSCADLKRSIELMNANFDCIPFLYRGSEIHALEVDEVIGSSARKSGKTPKKVTLEEMCASPCVKVMFRTKNKEEVQKMEQYLAHTQTPGLNWFKTQDTLMEVSQPGVSKAIALPVLCDQLHIKKEEIMACGDTTNDNEMLKEAGIGICLANGTDDTKALADQITQLDNDHDGLAHHFVEHYPQFFE